MSQVLWCPAHFFMVMGRDVRGAQGNPLVN